MTPNVFPRIRTSPISFFKYLLFTVKVEGESAFPELISGRRYFATSLKKPKVGDFIVFENPRGKEIMVKKISAIENNGFRVEGTLSWATSSETIGLVPRSSLLGVVLKK